MHERYAFDVIARSANDEAIPGWGETTHSRPTSRQTDSYLRLHLASATPTSIHTAKMKANIYGSTGKIDALMRIEANSVGRP